MSCLLLSHATADRSLARLDYIRFTPAHILNVSVDVSYVAQQIAARFPTVDLHNASTPDGLTSLPSATYDFVYSNLTLAFFGADMSALSEYYRVLKPGGMLLFTSLGPDTFKELRACLDASDGCDVVPRFLDLHDVGDALLQTHFSNPVMDMEYLTLRYPDVNTLLDDCSEWIAMPSSLTHIDAAYARYRDAATQTIPVCCEVIYGHAWKPNGPLTVPADATGEATFPIDQLFKQK